MLHVITTCVTAPNGGADATLLMALLNTAISGVPAPVLIAILRTTVDTVVRMSIIRNGAARPEFNKINSQVHVVKGSVRPRFEFKENPLLPLLIPDPK